MGNRQESVHAVDLEQGTPPGPLKGELQLEREICATKEKREKTLLCGWGGTCLQQGMAKARRCLSRETAKVNRSGQHTHTETVHRASCLLQISTRCLNTRRPAIVPPKESTFLLLFDLFSKRQPLARILVCGTRMLDQKCDVIEYH